MTYPLRRWRSLRTIANTPTELDRSNPLSKGLVLLAVGGTTVDLTARRALTNTAATPGSGKLGACWTFGDNSSLQTPHSADFNLSSEFTVFGVVRSTKAAGTAAADQQFLVNKNYDGSVPFSLNIGPHPMLGGAAFYSSGWFSSGVVTNITGDGAVHVVVGTFKSAGGVRRLAYYIDGKLDSWSAPSRDPAPNSAPVYLGRYQGDGASLRGDGFMFGVANRAWGADEVAMFAANPLQILQKRAESVYLQSQIAFSPDITPPSFPGPIEVPEISSTSYTITWPEAADAFGVVDYEFSLDGGATWASAGLALSKDITGRTPLATDAVQVRAKDPSGNYSVALSATVQLLADVVAPVLTGSITVSGRTATGYTLSWPAASDDVEVAGYEYSVDAGATWTEAGLVFTKAITGRSAAVADQVRVRAYDPAGNRSTPLATEARALDTVKPTLSGAITITARTTGGYTVTWPPGSDNAAVAGYKITIRKGVTYYDESAPVVTLLDIGNATTYTRTGATLGTLETFYVYAYDLDGNLSDSLRRSNILIIEADPPVFGAGDLEPSDITATGYTLSWPAATDASGVADYEVSLDGGATWASVGVTLTVPITGRTPLATDAAQVRAKDSNGNYSAPLSASVTLLADTTPPTLTGEITVSNATSTGYTLHWPSGTDNHRVAGYEVSLDAGETWTDAGAVLSRVITGRTVNVADPVRVRAYDPAGNRSVALEKAVTPPDQTAPTLAGAPTLVRMTSDGYVVQWPAGADNIAVTGYEVALLSMMGGAVTNRIPAGGGYLDVGGVLTYTATGRAIGAVDTFSVRAYDAAGNRSGTLSLSDLVIADVDAPVLAGELVPSEFTPTGYRLTWQAATDNVGVSGYELSLDNGATWVPLGLGLTTTVTGRTPESTDTPRIRARDAAGNRSAALMAMVTLLPTPDGVPPVLVGELAAYAITGTAYTLSWPPATDNKRVAGYEISVDGGATWEQVGNVQSARIENRPIGSTDTPRVRAFDAAGNRSAALSRTVQMLAPSAPTPAPQRGLAPLRESWEFDQVEADLKASTIAVFERMIRPRLQRVDLYGMPHRADEQTLDRFIKAEGLVAEWRPDRLEHKRELFRGWRARNPRRGLEVLRYYLQLLWPNQASVEQLWMRPDGQYPQDAVPYETPGAFLTSRVRVTIWADDVAESDMQRLAASLRSVMAARFVLELVRGRRIGGDSTLRMASAAHMVQSLKLSGTAVAGATEVSASAEIRVASTADVLQVLHL